jgi:hypothetical protein
MRNRSANHCVVVAMSAAVFMAWQGQASPQPQQNSIVLKDEKGVTRFAVGAVDGGSWALRICDAEGREAASLSVAGNGATELRMDHGGELRIQKGDWSMRIGDLTALNRSAKDPKGAPDLGLTVLNKDEPIVLLAAWTEKEQSGLAVAGKSGGVATSAELFAGNQGESRLRLREGAADKLVVRSDRGGSAMHVFRDEKPALLVGVSGNDTGLAVVDEKGDPELSLWRTPEVAGLRIEPFDTKAAMMFAIGAKGQHLVSIVDKNGAVVDEKRGK